jgi:hypothetical protein
MLAVIYLESQRIFTFWDYSHSCNQLNHHYLTGFRGGGSRLPACPVHWFGSKSSLRR